ncbi:hypothetical protein HDU67_000932 [Dinochytrium kinnereticum]|nr:hypothetical protein HDU67_000932 [Dinochytrium kinnereticum]
MEPTTAPDLRSDDAAVAMENLLHLETMFEELGREDGIRDGKTIGVAEGKGLGLVRGFDVGREVGFYLGACEMWIDILKTKPDRHPQRAMKMLEAIVAQAHAFPMSNDHEADMEGELTKMRAKFKAATTVLGVPSLKFKEEEDGKTPKLNF